MASNRKKGHSQLLNSIRIMGGSSHVKNEISNVFLNKKNSRQIKTRKFEKKLDNPKNCKHQYLLNNLEVKYSIRGFPLTKTLTILQFISTKNIGRDTIL